VRADQDRDMQAFLAGLGQRVREARAKRGMARRILARASGVSERYLAQLESGTGNPSIAVLRQIALAVDYPLADLIAGVGDGGPDFARILRLLESAPRSQLPKIRTQVEMLLTGKGERDKRHPRPSARRTSRFSVYRTGPAGRAGVWRQYRRDPGAQRAAGVPPP
jgi:XRE family aerobic/anaerobic benzoate catabolism transcriptional regulator